jgi:predicted acylesterase/phospholipase RssA
MLKKISNKALSLFRSDAKNRQVKIAQLADEMIALDKAKEVHQIASKLSELMKNKLEHIDNISDKDIVSYLQYMDSIFFDNAGQSWQEMPSDIKAEAKRLSVNHFMHKPDKKDIHGIAISGGGGKGQFYVGAIAAIEDEGLLSQIKAVSGASAGALTAIPLAMGCSSSELADIVSSTDFRAFFIETNWENKKCQSALSDLFHSTAACNNHRPWVRDLGIGDGSIAESDSRAIFSDLESRMNDDFLSMIHTFGDEVEETRIKAVMKHIETFAKSANPDNNYSINSKTTYSVDNPVENEYIKNGGIIQFLDVRLDKPLKTPFSSRYADDIVDELWESEGIQEYAESALQIYNEAIGYDYFTEAKDIISISVTKSLSSDYIEYFLSDLVKKKVHDFVSVHGTKPLEKIHPSLVHHSEWNTITMAQFGNMVEYDRASPNPIGLKELAIAVTEASSRYNILFNGKGVFGKGIFVSSDLSKTDSVELSNLPISKIGRMSMSIPFVFKAVEHGGKKFVDGGMYNNLPTDYFDRQCKVEKIQSRMAEEKNERDEFNISDWAFVDSFEDYRFDKNILSIIPATESEFVAAGKVKDIFSTPEKFHADVSEGFFSTKTYKCILLGIKNKLISVVKGKVMMITNGAYRNMSEKSDFRNILINTGSYGTMSFKPNRYDFTNINWHSFHSVSGGSRVGIEQKSVFESDYSSNIRLQVAKLRHHTEKVDLNDDELHQMKKNSFMDMQKTQPFLRSKNNEKAVKILRSELAS